MIDRTTGDEAGGRWRKPSHEDARMSILRSSLAAMVAVALTAGTAEAQRCKKGIPCGNTCIAASKTCRVGAGTATKAGSPASAPATKPAPTSAPAARTTPPATAAVPGTPAAPSPATRARGEPVDGGWVAAKDGKIYYFHACELLADIDSADRRYFRTEAAAKEAGLTRSKAKGC